MSRSTVSEWALPWGDANDAANRESLGVTLAWSLGEPTRVGETARIDAPTLLGRGDPGTPERILAFGRERPSGRGSARPLDDARISRRQLELSPKGEGHLSLSNVGKCPSFVNGRPVTTASVGPGDVITLQNAAVLLVVRRGPLQPLASYPARLAFPFGGPDVHGLVGESPALWQLRDTLAFAAASPHHVLVHGPSGAGKELAARALHALSSRAAGPFVARNAATLPSALVDAELFGNLKNYPNPGMAERKGLIGEADGGTLFLDEIGELPSPLQAHLLRVLDQGGEYQRLGESRQSKADFRLLAATNRPLTELKHDLLARFSTRIELPPLAARREDIPLLARHVLRRGGDTAANLDRFIEAGPDRAEVRIEPAVIELLLRHTYTHELRELERLLWVAASTSRGRYLAATPEFRSALDVGEAPAEPAELGRAEVVRALDGAGGNVTQAARALGLKNRFVLYRLMKRLGIEAQAEPFAPPDDG